MRCQLVGPYRFTCHQSAFSRRADKAGGAIVYWHVDDVRAGFWRLLALGATAHEEPVERGPGFVTASVIDPFGNLLGVMYNQHYVDVLAERPGA